MHNPYIGFFDLFYSIMGDYVVIPAYNEGSKIISVVEQAKKFTDNVVVIDDGSKDDTTTIADELELLYLNILLIWVKELL